VDTTKTQVLSIEAEETGKYDGQISNEPRSRRKGGTTNWLIGERVVEIIANKSSSSSVRQRLVQKSEAH